MLAQTLQSLEQDEFVRRVSFPIVPPHVEYSLTPLGEEVAQHVQSLENWIEFKLPEIMSSHKPGDATEISNPF